MTIAARHAGLAIIAVSMTSLGAAAQSAVNANAMAQIPARNPLTAEQRAGALPEGMGVLDRTRPEYDAAGLPLGGLTLYPTLAASVAVDDNILRTPAGAADTILTISPRMDLRSNWDTHALQLYGQLDHYDYQDSASETRTNWIIGGTGRLDIGPGSFLTNDTSYFDTHESRTSPDLSLLALSPTRYRRLHSDGMLTGQFSRFILSAALSHDRFDFDPTALTGGGVIDNSDRDRNVLQLTGRAAYQLTPEQLLFAQITYDRRDFDRLLDRNGINRNSDGYRMDVGAAMMLTPLIRATAYVGLLQQDYAAPLRDVSTMDFNLQLDWFATELLTAHVTASRTVDDTTIVGASSVDVRHVGASVDYELLRQLILQLSVNYYDYQFNGIIRDDRVVSTGLEARYLLNNNFAAYAGYSFQQRVTNAPGRDYTGNVFTFGLRSQL